MTSSPEPDPTRVCERYPAWSRPLGRVEALGNAGGLSGARLWRFVNARGEHVLRGWPTPGPSREQLERVHGWLARASALDFIPTPLAALDGRTIVEESGRLFEMSRWMPGRTEPCPPRDDRLRAGFVALAAFHERLAEPVARAASPGIRKRRNEVDDLTLFRLDQVEGALAGCASASARALATRWLEAARRASRGVARALRNATLLETALQPCLRDARAEHLLFDDGGRVTGLVDFGAMGIDSIAADVARLLGEWLEPGDHERRALALDAYARVRRLELDELRLIEAFESANALLNGARWAGWLVDPDRPKFDREDAIETGLARGAIRAEYLARVEELE